MGRRVATLSNCCLVFPSNKKVRGPTKHYKYQKEEENEVIMVPIKTGLVTMPKARASENSSKTLVEERENSVVGRNSGTM